MIRPMIQRFFTRIIIGILLGLVYTALLLKKVTINDVFFNYPLLTIGMICIMLGWFNYLKFDGIRVSLEIDQERRDKKIKRKKQKSKQMIDYVDTSVVEDQELLEDEKTVCNMIANLTAGFILILPSVVLLIIELVSK